MDESAINDIGGDESITALHMAVGTAIETGLLVLLFFFPSFLCFDGRKRQKETHKQKVR